MTDEMIITDNGDADLKERDAKIIELEALNRQLQIAVNVLRQRLIEVELELVNTRCELVARDNPG